MFFPVDLPRQKTLPLIIAQTIDLTPGSPVEAMVPMDAQQDVLLEGITGKVNWNPNGTGAGSSLQLQFGSQVQPWTSGLLDIGTFISPAYADPGDYFFAQFMRIMFPYSLRDSITVRVSGFSGAFPTLLTLCYWFRRSMGRDPFSD